MLRALLRSFALCWLFGVLPGTTHASTPVTAGYRDFSFGSTVIPTPTGEKPQSKLWWHDGSWWGCLWDAGSNRYRVHRFDRATQSFVNVGPDVDTRSQALVDALWDGTRLYIATHLFDRSGTFLLFSYTYDAGTRTWSARAGFPVTMGSGSAEALTIDKDTTGKLWITWEDGGDIFVNRSTTSETAWGTAFVLPVQGSSVSSDDLAAVAAFGGRIGILWSNQSDDKMYFASHLDGAADTSWQPRETALADAALGEVADDHINLKMLTDSGANIYAVTKTSLSNAGDPLIYLLRRDPSGNWTRFVVGRKDDSHTRPILLIDSENRKLYAFMTGSNGIRMKVSSLDNISFPLGSGTLFISSSSDGDINNATSTKQNVNGTTDIVVLASDEGSRFYLHNTIDLPSAGANPDIAVTPATWAFGNLALGQTASRIFQVQNTGTVTLNVTATSLAGTNATEFAITDGGGVFSLGAGASRDVTVRFAPTTNGGKTAVLRFASNDPDENPFDVALTGTGTTLVADIGVSPTSQDYGTLVVGTRSARTFQVRNDGGQDLHVSATTLTGSTPTQFVVQSGGGSFTLAPAATRDVVVEFAPTSTGAKSATLRFTSDDPDESPLDLGLSGSAVLPDIAVTPLLQDYGDVIVDQALFHTFEVRNAGTGNLDVSATTLTGANASQFRIDSGGGAYTLAPGATRIVAVSMLPNQVGAKNASLRFASNDPDASPLDVALSGNAAATPPGGGVVVHEGSVTGATANMSAVTSTTATGVGGRLYLASVSTRPLVQVNSVSGLGLTWARVDAQCGGRGSTGIELWVGTGTATTGTVTASLSGSPKAAVITVSRYAGAATVAPLGSHVAGNSNGVDGSCSGGTDATSYSLPLATTLYGSKVFVGVAIANRTNTPGSGYTQRATVRTGRNNSMAGLAVMDRPLLSAGGVMAAGSLSGSADYAVIAVEIRAGGTAAPEITVAPAAANYGSVVVGTNTTQTFHVRNDGTADLHVSATSTVGTNAADFALVSGSGAFTLAAGGTHDLGVRFTPGALGSRTAALRLVSDDADESTLDVGLAGTGVAVATPDITVTPSTYDYGSITIGANATKTFQVRNDGSANLDVTAPSLAGTNPGDFSITSGGGAFTLAPSATRDIVVAFAPTTSGARSALLRFASNDPDENPFDATLGGTGATAPPPGGTVAFVGSTSGGSVAASTVATAAAVPAVSGQLYLAAIAPKNNTAVLGVNGMGLVWSRVLAQCGARNQTGVEIWVGRGTPSAGVVTATLASAPNAAVIIVSRYSGADPLLGNTVTANTLGVSGPCSGGVDGTSFAIPLGTSANGALVFGAVSMRHKELTPGATWTQRDLARAGLSGSAAGLAIVERAVAAPGTVTLDGTFNEPVDWAVIGIEIRPATAAKPEAEPDPAPIAGIGLEVQSGFARHAPRIVLAGPVAAPARVDLFDVRGRRVDTLWNGAMPATRLELLWREPEDDAAGVYFVRAQIADRVFQRKLLLLR